MSLVIAGNYGVSFDEAEKIKKDKSREKEVFQIVRPVVEKMAAIIKSNVIHDNDARYRLLKCSGDLFPNDNNITVPHIIIITENKITIIANDKTACKQYI